MKRLEKFLFFYSILAVTVILISLGVFEPKPLNFIIGIALTPIIFYFWMRLTNPEGSSAEKWSIRFIISLLILSLLGIYAFRLASQATDIKPLISEELRQEQAKNEDLKSRLASVSAQLTLAQSASKSSDVKGEDVTDLLVANEITGKPGVVKIDVFESPSSISKKIDSLDGTQKYLYLDKQDNWYKIALSGSNVGWVSQNQVQEVN